MHLSTESKSTNVMKQKPFLLFVSLSTKVSTFSTEPNWPKYWRISSSERSSLSPPTKSLLTFSSRSERGCLSFDVCNDQFGFKHFYHLASNSTAEESVRKDFAYLGNNALCVHLLSIQSVWSFWLQQINARGFVKCNKTESSRSTKPTERLCKASRCEDGKGRCHVRGSEYLHHYARSQYRHTPSSLSISHDNAVNNGAIFAEIFVHRFICCFRMETTNEYFSHMLWFHSIGVTVLVMHLNFYSAATKTVHGK